MNLNPVSPHETANNARPRALFTGVAVLVTLTPEAAIAQYVIDDGSAEGATGLANGGDLICLNSFVTLPSHNTITSISIALQAALVEQRFCPEWSLVHRCSLE